MAVCGVFECVLCMAVHSFMLYAYTNHILVYYDYTYLSILYTEKCNQEDLFY